LCQKEELRKKPGKIEDFRQLWPRCLADRDEINTKGTQSRFTKTARGKFTAIE